MLRRTERVIYRARQRELDEYGISSEAASNLFSIVRLGRHATPKVIAEHRLLERNTVWEHLTRMERQGLVEKSRYSGRKNRVRVVLTPRGQEAFSKSIICRSIKSITAGLTPREHKELWLLLSRLRTRALERLEMRDLSLYPPSDPEEMMKTGEGRSVAGLDHGLWQMLRRTVRVIHMVRRRELAGYGISTEEASVLLVIVALGSQATPRSIARERLLERHTVSEHLARMEKRGLISKVMDPDHKNRMRVVPTPVGMEAYSRSVSRLRGWVESIMSTLTSQEQEKAWFLLSRLRTKALEHLGTEDVTVREELTADMEAFAGSRPG